MRTAYFDLIGGAAGDMLLGALLDAGAPRAPLLAGLERLGLGAQVEFRHEMRGYLRAGRVEVVPPDGPQPHRHLSDLLRIVAGAELPPRAAARAERVFRALAEAEARVHGETPEQVHFHEVGAVDSIVDVVGVCLALELLEIERVESGPLPLGKGLTRSAHGPLPLPAPAVLYLAEAAGAAVVGSDADGEQVTPTGAALLTALGARFGPCPSLRVERVGYGAGTRRNQPPRPPNVTRVVLGNTPEPAEAGEVVVLEANIDDQSPELSAFLIERLLAAGALDAVLLPIAMKKGRPGVLLSVIAAPDTAGLLEDLLLRESSTLGLRRRREERRVLPREQRDVETPFGTLRVKLARRPDGRRTVAPEYEDCARAARKHGAPLAEVYAAAQAAAAQLEPQG